MNNRNTMNCGDILICVECGKRFDEEESPHMFFCSDACKGMFTLKALREANAKRMEIVVHTTGFCMECGAQYNADDVEYISFCSTTCYWKYRQKHDLKKYAYTDEKMEEIIKRINKFKKEKGL